MEGVCVVGEGTAIINASTIASELGILNNLEQSGPQPEKLIFLFYSTFYHISWHALHLGSFFFQGKVTIHRGEFLICRLKSASSQIEIITNNKNELYVTCLFIYYYYFTEHQLCVGYIIKWTRPNLFIKELTQKLIGIVEKILKWPKNPSSGYKNSHLCCGSP